MLRAIHLVGQQLALLLGAGELGLRAADLGGQFGYLAVDHGYLRVELVLACGHHRDLVCHRLAQRGLCVRALRIDAEVRRIAAVALGDQPGFRSTGRIAIGNQHLEPGARIAVVERDQELSLLDTSPVADQKLADDAAIGMLHALAPTLDLEIAAGNGGPEIGASVPHSSIADANAPATMAPTNAGRPGRA